MYNIEQKRYSDTQKDEKTKKVSLTQQEEFEKMS